MTYLAGRVQDRASQLYLESYYEWLYFRAVTGMDQYSIVDAARDIVVAAKDEYKPVKTYCMFSGGNDSTVLLHLMWTAGLIDGAVHINTGIGIEQTREFVRNFCRDYEIPLIEKHPPSKSYEELVTELGFPGPAMHHVMYRMLKERAIRQLVTESKTHRMDKVLLISGIRRQESQRRANHEVVDRRGAQVFVSPIIDASKRDLVAYRREHGVPENEVAAVLHMSGECLCGAYAKPGELQEIEAWYPEAGARIRELEAKVAASGQARCRWGWYHNQEKATAGGPLCSDCDLRAAA